MDSFPKMPIPSENVDYREVARVMRINIDILKSEITEHIDEELERFHKSMNDIKETEKLPKNALGRFDFPISTKSTEFPND